MAKRNNMGLYVTEIDYGIDQLTQLDTLPEQERDNLKYWPVDYIIHNDEQAYIGQTISIEKRTKQHVNNNDVGFGMQKITIIGQEEFNRSASYNIETNLINNFIGDTRFKQILNKSQTEMTTSSDYYNKAYYDTHVFSALWEKLQEMKLAKQSLEEIANSDIFKLSPFKSLSDSQLELKQDILNFCRERIDKPYSSLYLIRGEAGTGKSVVLSSIFNAVQTIARTSKHQVIKDKLAGTNNYLLVNHSEMLKTYKSLARKLSTLRVGNFDKPTPFINKMEKKADQGKSTADIIFVDEAHLLLTKEDHFNNFYHKNQLEELLHLGKIIIAVFDPYQVLKLKSHWDDLQIKRLVNNNRGKTFQLTEQFRMQASQKVIEWINTFTQRQIIKTLPKNTGNFDFRIFNNAEEMFEAIDRKNQSEKLSRVVATFDYPYSTVDQQDHFIEEGDFKKKWNTTDSSTTWAERPETINEVGSIYTVQGFDLNYVGVILGPSIYYDHLSGKIQVNLKEYQDSEAFKSRDDLSDTQLDNEKGKIILNSINVLMKRGVHGLYIYAHDPILRKKLLSLS